MAYDSLIADMGTLLSGGQNWPARLYWPRFLFMDWGTSPLGVATERRITAVAQALRLNRVIIAHHPEGTAAAPRRLVLHDAELNELQGVY